MADCTIKQSSSGPSECSGRTRSAGPLAPAVPVVRTEQRRREADRAGGTLATPSILDCQTARMIHPASLPNAQTASVQACSAARAPRLQQPSPASSADSNCCDYVAPPLTTNSTATVCSKAGRASNVLKGLWVRQAAAAERAPDASLCLHQHLPPERAGNAVASVASGSVLDRFGVATCAQPSYVRL
jgi:hypothetical protein